MPHAHLIVQHALKQVDLMVSQRGQRDPRPAWLAEFVQRAAEWFEPLAGVGRVGFECEPTEAGWEARLYLGSLELVGGKDDGQWKPQSFELNLLGLRDCFTVIDEFCWNVAAGEAGGSFITLRGLVGEHDLCLKAYSRAPHRAGPGMRQYHDGRIQPID